MIIDHTVGAGPRRHLFKVDVNADAVGPIFSLLIKEVEHPKMEQAPDGCYRIEFVCMLDQMATIFDIISDKALNVYVKPFVPEVKATFVQRERPVGSNIVPSSRVTILPPSHPKLKRGAKVSETAYGRVLLAVFKDGKIAHHNIDFHDAAVAAGYSAQGASAIISALVAEGVLVRISRGVYRLPHQSLSD